MFNNKLVHVFKYILLFIPAIVGFYGFSQINGVSSSWALYYTARLFSLNTDLTDINIYIEFARWTAPLSTASFFVLLFNSLREKIMSILICFKKDSITVYGDGQAAQQLIKSLGNKGIHGKNKICKTKIQVILFDEEEKNLSFYREHEEELSLYRVYICLENIHIRSINKAGVFPFSMTENCAKTYWSKYPPNANEKIALIGNSNLNDALLTDGLQVNLLSLSQHIEYNVWKNNNDYPYLHTQLNNITLDSISFYDTAWYESFVELSNMDRIILCGTEKENLDALGKLSAFMVHPKVYVFANSYDFINRFFKSDSIIPFGASIELATEDIIINEKLYQEAIKEHNNYYKNYGGKKWEELDEFKKGSNVSSVSYQGVIKKLKISGASNDELAQLEHLRWCRYHYLNNWSYNANRDDTQKHHPLLVDYDELSDIDKEKDMKIILNTINN